jgi:hypothetical protein
MTYVTGKSVAYYSENYLKVLMVQELNGTKLSGRLRHARA